MNKTLFLYNLVPCQRGHEPRLKATPDLTQNVHIAQSIVDRMEQFFHFETPWPTFSGHARPADKNDGRNHLLYVQMVDKKGAYRSFAFRTTGYVGVLNIENRGNRRAFFIDYLYALEDGLSQGTRTIEEDWAEHNMGLVVGGELEVRIEI